MSTQFNRLFQAIQFSQTVLIQTIQFRTSIVFCPQLDVKTFLFQTIQFSESTVSVSKICLFQTIQFTIGMQFEYQNTSISNNSV